jgi:hypothetical protein
MNITFRGFEVPVRKVGSDLCMWDIQCPKNDEKCRKLFHYQGEWPHQCVPGESGGANSTESSPRGG